MTHLRIGRLLAGLALVALVPTVASAQRYRPGLEFKTISTAHFWIHFHQGEEELAARLAGLAEEVRTSLLKARPSPEPGKTHVILSGQDDTPNGWATTVPFNMIEIRAVWPRPASAIGNSTDWLRLVFTHEYSHILHLDRSTGVFAAARHVFGRVPFAMPNLFLPIWQVEGIATWRESIETGDGRVHDGSVRRTLSAAARAGAFGPIDRASGGLVSWPGGDAPYFYGSMFHEYLARRFGADSAERLTTETARWPPFFGTFAFKRAFGVTPQDVWRDFKNQWTSTLASAPPQSPARQVTHDGFQTSSPRWDPAKAGVLFYQRRTPHAFGTLRRLDVATGESSAVAEQLLGESISVRGERVLFDQLDFASNVALVSDLYLIGDTARPSSVRRLTHGERAGDADLSPDGSQAAFVVTAADRRYLATMKLGDAESAARTTILISEPGTYFSRPRWSPDGSSLVAERQTVQGRAEIVLIDVAARTAEPVAPGFADRQVTPAWTPDGATVVFAAARTDEPFNLFAVSLADRATWQVTARTDGARAPDVSPDGKQLAFLGYTVEGEDVFVASSDRAMWRPVDPRLDTRGLTDTASLTAAPAPGVARSEPAPAEKKYSPLHGFVPRYWAPIVETGDDGIAVGAMSSGADALGRHAWNVAANVWSKTGQADVDVTYSYRRFRPWLFASLSREGRAAPDGILTSHTVSTGVVLPQISVRQTQQFIGLLRAEHLALEAPDFERITLSRNAVRLGWSLATARSFAYSISAEEGWVASVASEHVRPALGSDGRADAFLAEGRYYRRAGPEHAVIAVRAAAAVSGGDRQIRQQFTLAGDGPAEGPLAFDSDAIALFRGAVKSGAFGTRATVLNIDYRFPLWRVERGVGAYPGFFRWLHGSVFADTADAWSQGRSPRPYVAAGAELAADLVLGHSLPLTVAAGVSWRADAQRPDNTPHIFARVGKAF